MMRELKKSILFFKEIFLNSPKTILSTFVFISILCYYQLKFQTSIPGYTYTLGKFLDASYTVKLYIKEALYYSSHLIFLTALFTIFSIQSFLFWTHKSIPLLDYLKLSCLRFFSFLKGYFLLIKHIVFILITPIIFYFIYEEFILTSYKIKGSYWIHTYLAIAFTTSFGIFIRNSTTLLSPFFSATLNIDPKPAQYQSPRIMEKSRIESGLLLSAILILSYLLYLAPSVAWYKPYGKYVIYSLELFGLWISCTALSSIILTNTIPKSQSGRTTENAKPKKAATKDDVKNVLLEMLKQSQQKMNEQKEAEQKTYTVTNITVDDEE